MGGSGDQNGGTGAREAAPPPRNPTVTMTLFAYNQEAFIRDAVLGAFAQTYQPLEIILSDDCSTDRTFEIMQDLVDAYRGPHRVVLRRNAQNMGVIPHYNLVFGMVEAEIIVFAAGDDISLPQRTATLVRRLQEDPSAVLVHSGTQTIDAAGKQGGPFAPPVQSDDPDPRHLAYAKAIYIGATGAFRRDFFQRFGPIVHVETYEDIILGFRAALVGGLRYIDEPLVLYRTDVGVSFVQSRKQPEWRAQRVRLMTRRIATLSQRLADLDRSEHPDRQTIARMLRHRLWRLGAQRDYLTDRAAFWKGLASMRFPAYAMAWLAETRFRTMRLYK